MASSRTGLGRGLAALLGDADPASAQPPVRQVSPTQVNPPPAPAATRDEPAAPPFDADGADEIGAAGAKVVPIAKVHRNPDQPRKKFSEKELAELAESIRARGLLQPILVRPLPGTPGSYQIVAGERRWRAAQKAGLHDVSVVVRDFDDQEVLEISIVENVQRQDLNAMEEARGYQALIDQFGHTQEDIAKAVGKSRSHVANMLRLLALPETVREMVYEDKLTAGHARAIVTAADPEALARRIIDAGLSVREAEALARDTQGKDGGKHKSGGTAKPADLLALEQQVMDVLGLAFDIRPKPDGSGEVRIRFTSSDQLTEVCRRLQRLPAA